MKKTVFCGASLGLLMLAVALASPRAGAAAAANKTSKEIMGALFKGPKSAMATLKSATKASPPDWAKIKKLTETFETDAADLPKNEPSKGDKASFEKLAKAFATNAKTLNKAASDEDLKGVQEAMGNIGKSCMGCHKAHRPS